MQTQSAHIIPLPTAIAQPVIQQRRRGRFPKIVMTISEARFKRGQREKNSEVARQIALLECLANTASGMVKEYLAEANALRQQGVRHG